VRRDRFEIFEPTLSWAGRIRKEERMATSFGDVAADFDKGPFAGVAGTAAMTVSSTLEMKLSGRGVSQTPAHAAEEVLNVQPEDEESEARFSNLVHLAYGTGWGGVPHHSP
jgi:hypothetical protein